MEKPDTEWLTAELERCGAEEQKALKRHMKAQENLVKAKAELASAKESLTGIRGMMTVFRFELEYTPPAPDCAVQSGLAEREMRTVMLTRYAAGNYVFSGEEYAGVKKTADGFKGKPDGERLAALNELLAEKKRELRERLSAHAGE
jgi:hypothetical protein